MPRRVYRGGKTLTEQFATVLITIFETYGQIDTKDLYEHIEHHTTELCTNRGQVRPWVVWQRDARNALKYLLKQEIIEYIPTEGWERKGTYRLIKK